MDRKFMGSELLTGPEAASLLGVDLKTIARMARNGWITPHYSGSSRKSPRYKREEILAITELKNWRRPDLATVNRIAVQALVRSRAVEKRLEQLCILLGADGSRLETSEEEVVRLFLRVEDQLALPEMRLESQDVLEWGRIFLGMNEEYLELVRLYITPPEPWGIFVELARRISEKAADASAMELRSAYAYFEVARRSLRNVAYFYIRRTEGVREARKRFPDSVGDYKTTLISTVFPH
jgi:hypothetical protein